MTTDTLKQAAQALREALEKLPCVQWSKTRSTVQIPETEDFAGKALHITGLDKQYARHLAAYIAAANPAMISALLDELDSNRAAPIATPEHDAKVRAAALEEAARAAYLLLFPKNDRSDWTPYAHAMAEAAERVAIEIQSLKSTGADHG